MTNALTDFNDLHCAAGLDVVRRQLLAALDSPVLGLIENNTAMSDSSSFPILDSPPLSSYADDSPAPPDVGGGAPSSSPHPSDAESRFSLEILLQRFSLAMPDGKIWDARDSRFIKKGAARDWWGEKAFKAWMQHESRATVMQDDVAAFAAAAQLRGRGGLSDALNRYIYIDPTDSVWDVARRRRIPVSALKLAIADVFDGWLKHPTRRDIDEENLVFNPGGALDQKGKINTFRGLPLDVPEGDVEEFEAGCEKIRDLIFHLTNNDAEIFWWIVKWLAYPLQHVGAKMASALLLHSDVQGSGKSLLFEEVVKPLYGEYGSTLGQHQLESQYTDWRSQLLFALFEEIFSGATKFSHTGQMKQMITGKTQRIEKKYMAGWEEANHMNAVFLSNETQPFPLDPSDRRMLVLWPRKKLTEELKANVLAEIANGGVTAFLGYLMKVPLDGFHTHTEPPITDAKQDLIDYSRYGWDLFHRDWKAGTTDWPYTTCLITDLYQCYKRWCSANGERDLSLNKFSSNLGKRERKRRDLDYEDGYNIKKGNFIIVSEQPDGVSQKKWLRDCLDNFRKFMKTGENPSS